MGDGSRHATTAVVTAVEPGVGCDRRMKPTRPAEPLDPATLWRSLQQLVARVTEALEGEAAVDDCLDIVVDLLGADRGLVLLEQEDGTTHVINARGARRALAPSEREEVSRTIMRKAIDSDAIVAWSAAEQPLDSASVLSLGIAAALVAPLRARGLPRGVLYVDFRAPTFVLVPAQREFFMAAVLLIAGMADQASMTRVARDRLAAAEGPLTQSTAPRSRASRPAERSC